MKKSLLETIKDTARQKMQNSPEFSDFLTRLGKTSEEVTLQDLDSFSAERKSVTDKIFDAMQGRGNVGMSIRDMVSVSQMDGIMREVVSRVLVSEKEPALFLSENVAEKFPMTSNTQTLEFINSSAFVATEMAPNQEYQLHGTALQEATAVIRVGKQGIGYVIPDEALDTKTIDMAAVYLRKCANAVNRLVESNCYTVMTSTPNIAADNTTGNGSGSGYATLGVDGSNTANGTFGYEDLVNLVSVPMSFEKDVTHVLTHPLAWSVIASDPFLRATFVNGGQIGTSVWSAAPGFDQTMNLPFGLLYVPYAPTRFVRGGDNSGANITDIYAICAPESIALAEKGSLEMAEEADFWKDGRGVKVKRETRAVLKDKGAGVAKTVGVVISPNRQAVVSVRTYAS